MQANLLELAKQGDPQAIATLMNQALNTQGVTIQATLRKECLHILMESQQKLEPNRIVPALQRAMLDLQSPVIQKVRVYGHHISESSSIWGQVIHLRETQEQPRTLRGTALLESLSDDDPPTAIRAVLKRPNLTTDSTAGFAASVSSRSSVSDAGLDNSDDVVVPDPASAFDPIERDDICGVFQPPYTKSNPMDTHEATSLTAAVVLNKSKKGRKDQYRLGILGKLVAVICGAGLGTLLLGSLLKPSPTYESQTPLPQEPMIPLGSKNKPKVPETPTTLAPLPATTQAISPPSVPSATPPSPSAPSPTIVPTTTRATSATQPINLSVTTTGKSWVEAIADGQKQYVGILEPGMQKAWNAQKSLILRVGSAGYVVASFNQADAKPLGEPGEVLELEYSPKGIQSRLSSRN